MACRERCSYRSWSRLVGSSMLLLSVAVVLASGCSRSAPKEDPGLHRDLVKLSVKKAPQESVPFLPRDERDTLSPETRQAIVNLLVVAGTRAGYQDRWEEAAKCAQQIQTLTLAGPRIGDSDQARRALYSASEIFLACNDLKNAIGSATDGVTLCRDELTENDYRTKYAAQWLEELQHLEGTDKTKRRKFLDDLRSIRLAIYFAAATRFPGEVTNLFDQLEGLLHDSKSFLPEQSTIMADLRLWYARFRGSLPQVEQQPFPSPALQEYRLAYESLAGSLSPADPFVAQARSEYDLALWACANSFSLSGSLEKASKAGKELLTFRRKAFGENDWRVADAGSFLEGLECLADDHQRSLILTVSDQFWESMQPLLALGIAGTKDSQSVQCLADTFEVPGLPPSSLEYEDSSVRDAERAREERLLVGANGALRDAEEALENLRDTTRGGWNPLYFDGLLALSDTAYRVGVWSVAARQSSQALECFRQSGNLLDLAIGIVRGKLPTDHPTQKQLQRRRLGVLIYRFVALTDSGQFSAVQTLCDQIADAYETLGVFDEWGKSEVQWLREHNRKLIELSETKQLDKYEALREQFERAKHTFETTKCVDDSFAAAAELLETKIIRSVEQLCGTSSLFYVECLALHMGFCDGQNRHGESLAVARQTEAILGQVLSCSHPVALDAADEVTVRLMRAGEYAKAEKRLLKAVELRKQLHEPRGLERALFWLSTLNMVSGELARSLEMLEQTYAVSQEESTSEWKNFSAMYTVSLLLTGRVGEALHESAMSCWNHKQMLPMSPGMVFVGPSDTCMEDPSVLYAQGLNYLGMAFYIISRRDFAERLWRDAYATLTEFATPTNDYRNTLSSVNQNLARASLDRGDLNSAEAYACNAKKAESESSSIQLSFCGDSYYDDLLAEILIRQGKPKEAAALLEESLETTSHFLSTAFKNMNEEQRLRVAGFARRVLNLYLEAAPLADIPAVVQYDHVLRWKGSAFSSIQNAVPLQSGHSSGALTKAVQGALAQVREDVMLLDFNEYRVRAEDGLSKRQYCVFVVTDKSVTRRELGPVARVDGLIGAWLAEIGAGNGPRPAQQSQEQLVAELGRLILTDIAPPDVLSGLDLLIVSPDGGLSTFPFGVIPGLNGKTYLIEELPLVVLPFARSLCSSPCDRTSNRRLCVVSNVNYDTEPARKTDGGRSEHSALDAPLPFPLLPEAGRQVEKLKAIVRNVERPPVLYEVSGDSASESAFREQSEGCQYIHLVTHGYVASPLPTYEDVLPARSTADRLAATLWELNRPIVLSERRAGLALAGANRLAGVSNDGDDGILTAAEIYNLNLTGVDLVFLAACNTHIGEAITGEGVLSLQRAFEASGCRGVVSSLWAVESRSTNLLVEEFYRNLFVEDRPPWKALQLAQVHVIRKGSGDSRHPFFWAAWQFSGDPRNANAYGQ